MTDDQLPQHWLLADDIWEGVKKSFPSHLHEGLEQELEEVCRKLIQRVIDDTSLGKMAFSGEDASEAIERVAQFLVDELLRTRGSLLREILGLRINVSILEHRMDNLEKGFDG